MDWQVLEDEGRALPASVEEAAPPRRPAWGRWLALLGLLVVVVGGGLWWRLQQEQQNLRAALTQTIEQEARILGSGDIFQIMSELPNVVDPAAPESWRGPYIVSGAWLNPLTQLPTLQAVTLAEEGQLVLVTVQVPRPEGALYAGLEPIEEQRAYRLVEGAWRRTPLPLAETETIERRSDHFVLRGPAEALAAMEAERLLGDLEAMRTHLAAVWLGGRADIAPVTLEARPQEFRDRRTLYAQFDANPTRPIVVEVPATFKATPSVPLSAQTQYRLALMEPVVFRLTNSLRLNSDSFLLTEQVRLSEARRWALTPAEQRDLRNGWRGEAGGEWLSPLAGPFPIAEAGPNAEVERQQQLYKLALSLLLEYVRLSFGDEAIARLAREAASVDSSFTLAASFTRATGSTLDVLEAGAREFALTME